MYKVTMQDIANALGTSRISVWKAFHGQAGVSDELVHRVFAKAAELGYTRFPDASVPPSLEPPSARIVSVIVSRPESSVFWMQIIHQLAKELALNNINLMYTYLPTVHKSGYALPALLSNGSVNGAITLNVYDKSFLQLISALALPKVFLDTVPTLPADKLNGDLVILEGRSLTEKITEHLLAGGRTNLGFIGDVDYAQTNRDRYNGFCDAHFKRGLQINPANCYTTRIGLYTHYEEISDFIGGLGKMPDAFVCASDYIAHFVKRRLDEIGCAVPDDIMLSGFDNNTEYSNVANFVTTVNIETSTLGKRLARKIMLRMDAPKSAYEISYLVGEILYRASTEGETTSGGQR